MPVYFNDEEIKPTPIEIAKILGVDKQTVKMWASRLKLNPPRTGLWGQQQLSDNDLVILLRFARNVTVGNPDYPNGCVPRYRFLQKTNFENSPVTINVPNGKIRIEFTKST